MEKVIENEFFRVTTFEGGSKYYEVLVDNYNPKDFVEFIKNDE